MSFRVIQTTEQLKEYIHSIHDFIRNSGAGYGMSALKIFNVFYSLKIIKGKCQEFGIRKDLFDWQWLGTDDNCNDESMRNIVNLLRDYNNTQTSTDFVRLELENSRINTLCEKFEKYITPTQLEHFKNELKRINDDFDTFIKDRIVPENTKNMAFYIYHQIPINQDKEFYQTIYKLIDDIPSQVINSNDELTDNTNNLENVANKFDIKGKVYEYFIGRDKTAISELGAYFTDRYITNFTFEFINLELDENGRVQSMIDPFGGSGGFTIQYTKNINDKFEIDWSANDNYKQVHHFDMAEDVVKVAGVEYFSITGHFPIKDTQFKNTNTFIHEFNKKFQVVVSNPPYGGDKNKKSVDKDKNIMIIKLNKELINKIETLLKNMASNILTPKSKSKGKSKIGYDFEYKQLINEICKLDNEDSFIQDVINHYSTFCAKYDININDIEPFKQCLVHDPNSKNNFEFEVEINDSNDLFVFLAIMHRQIIELNKENDNEDEEQSDKKVNLRTCSDFITNYAVEIVNNDDITSRKLIIDAINNELLNQDNKSKFLNLNKSLKYYKSKPIKYVLDEKFKDSYFKDKEACSLILLMNLVEDNGICVGLLKEGVFFNSKYSLLRGFLIHNFNVTDIVSVPNKAFENTTTKTSMVVFKKNGSTTNINFWELDVEKSKNIFIKYNKLIGNKVQFLKEQILSVDKKFLCKASFKQLCKIKTTYNKNNDPSFELDYSLDYKNYMNYQVVCPPGFALKKIKDISIFDGKSKRLAEFVDETGKYRYYSSGGKILKCNEADFNDELSIIIGHSGNGCLFLDDTYSTLVTNHVLKINNRLLTYYIYNYLKQYWSNFFDRTYKGSTVKNTSNDTIGEYEVPIPLDINSLKTQLESLYNLHLQISNITQSIPDKEKHICGLIKRLIDEGKKGVDYDEYKLGDISKLQSGKYYTKDMTNTGEYPFYNACENNPLGTHNEYCFDGSKYIIMFIGGNINANTIGNVCLCSNKIASTRPTVMIYEYNKSPYDYLYYYLKLNLPETKKLVVTTTGLGWLNFEKISSIQIRVLKPHIMAQHNMQQLFDEVDNLKTVLETSQQEHKKQMNELFKDFTDEYIVTSSNNTNDESNEANDEGDDDSIVSVSVPIDEPVVAPKPKKRGKASTQSMLPEEVLDTHLVQQTKPKRGKASTKQIVEAPVETIIEAPVETIVEALTEPTVEALTEPIVEALTEPVVATSALKKKKKKAIVVQPTVEALTELTVEAQPEPTVETLTEPTVEALTEPTVEALTEPTVEALTEPTVEALTEPTVEAQPEIVVATSTLKKKKKKAIVVQPTIEALTEPIVETLTESIVETLTESIVEALTEPIVETQPEIVVATTTLKKKKKKAIVSELIVEALFEPTVEPIIPSGKKKAVMKQLE